MRGFLSFVITILLILAIGGGIYYWYTGEVPEIPKFPDINSSQSSESEPRGPEDIFDDYEKPNTGNNSGSGGNNGGSGGNNESSGGNESSGDNESSSGNNESSGNGGNTDTPEEPTLKELTVPSNASSLIQSGMTMQKGAALYLGDDTDRPEMRFTCEISSSLYSQNSANFKIGVLVAPQSYFDEVNSNSYTVIDWITAFNTEGKQYLTTYDVYESSRSSTGYLTQFVMTDIDYENINRKFAAIGFVKITNGGTVTYRYSSFPAGLTYRTNARSVAYVAGAALNAHALGLEEFDENDLAKLNNYMMESRDYARGLSVPTYNGDMPKVFLAWANVYKLLNIGDTEQLECYVEDDVELLIQYATSDESILKIDSQGMMTRTGSGEVTIYVYVYGLYAEIDVDL